jgi:mannose-6-phosphate isomerase-like protein (cupin superfamily)
MTPTLDDIWFENPRQGQRVRFLVLPSATDGRRFVLEYASRPFTGETAVPAHLHPTATETFEILAGQARYRLGATDHSLRSGEQAVLPANVPHVHPWSNSADELRVRQTTEVDPPDEAGLTASLQALVTLFGLAAAGKVNAKGLPNILQLAVAVHSTMPATYLAHPPIPVPRLLFGSLAGLGRVLGYRTAYPQYGILTSSGLQRATAPGAI